jgi:DNA modification methylase
LPEKEFEDLINGFVSVLNILNQDVYYVWCNWKFYATLQRELEYKACIVWAKNVFGMGTNYRHQHEFCLFNGSIDDQIKNESDLWEVKKDTNYVHPTQKPVQLMAWCLDIAKVPAGATVLDPFMGSGSTGIACLRTGRNFIGIERDAAHYKTACDRIAHELDGALL